MQSRATAAEAGRRLDVWLTDKTPDLSRSQMRRWFTDGRVRVNGAVARAGLVLKADDLVEWDPPEPPPSLEGGPPPEALPLDIIYQDEALLVVNKAPGMVVHPGAGVRTGTLVGALKGHGITLAGLGGPIRPGIVHRLDRGTSGLLVIARTDVAYAALVRSIQAREVRRRYRALVWGITQEDDGRIEGAIARSRVDPRRMTVVRQGGRPAATRFRVRARYPLVTDLELELETGRTHQIRVHWRQRGQPVFGDPDYGGRTRVGLTGPDRALVRRWLSVISRQALHADRLEFHHPLGGALLSFEAPLPPDMAALFSLVEGGGRPEDRLEDQSSHTG